MPLLSTARRAGAESSAIKPDFGALAFSQTGQELQVGVL